MTWKPLPAQPGQDNPKPLGASLDRLNESLGAPSNHVLRTVFGRWEDVVGHALASHATPLSIREGTLVIAVSDVSWATELRWLATELLEKFAAVVGEPVASRVEIRILPASTRVALGTAPSGKMRLSSGTATQVANAEIEGSSSGPGHVLGGRTPRDRER
jgi:predicted nucleic acid-binding Zn ribbon protein